MKRKFTIFYDLLKHVAKHHEKEQCEVKDVKDTDGKEIQVERVKLKEKVQKERPFVFYKSMLDEFLYYKREILTGGKDL